MRILYDMGILNSVDGIESKISFLAFAAFISMQFGGSTWLLVAVQYIFIADFFLGMLDAVSEGAFSLQRIWQGIKKIVSLYFGVLVVGFGTRAFDVAISGRLQIEYDGAFLFDAFLCTLIVFELASINGYLARLGFGVNQGIDSFLYKFKGKTQNKIEKLLDRALEGDGDGSERK